MADNLDVLCIFDEPEAFSSMLESRFPDVGFRYARTPAEVLAELDGEGPDVAFSIKHPGFPGESHAPILKTRNLKWLQVGGSGYEQFVPWDADRMVLTNAAGVLSRYLVETNTGAMLAMNSSLFEYKAQQQRKHWEMRGFFPVCDQTVLIVGAGTIGGQFADNCKALGMTVLGVRGSGAPHPSVDEMHTPDKLNELLPRADVVSLHVRATETTRAMFNADTFALMKPGALFLNTARGLIVDEAALVEALRSGHIGGAYLDVFEQEPLPSDSPLWSLDNVLLTPHASDQVRDWPLRIARFFADNLARWLAGEPLDNQLTA